MGKKYLETKKDSLESSILGVWQNAIEEGDARMDGRTKQYREHRKKLESARARRVNKEEVELDENGTHVNPKDREDLGTAPSDTAKKQKTAKAPTQIAMIALPDRNAFTARAGMIKLAKTTYTPTSCTDAVTTRENNRKKGRPRCINGKRNHKTRAASKSGANERMADHWTNRIWPARICRILSPPCGLSVNASSIADAARINMLPMIASCSCGTICSIHRKKMAAQTAEEPATS